MFFLNLDKHDLAVGATVKTFQETTHVSPVDSIFKHKTSHPNFMVTMDDNEGHIFLAGMGRFNESEISCGW